MPRGQASVCRDMEQRGTGAQLLHLTRHFAQQGQRHEGCGGLASHPTAMTNMRNTKSTPCSVNRMPPTCDTKTWVLCPPHTLHGCALQTDVRRLGMQA